MAEESRYRVEERGGLFHVVHKSGLVVETWADKDKAEFVCYTMNHPATGVVHESLVGPVYSDDDNPQFGWWIETLRDGDAPLLLERREIPENWRELLESK
jgi:hypothetical protein